MPTLPAPVDLARDWILLAFPRIIAALLILLAVTVGWRWLSAPLGRALARSRLDPTLAGALLAIGRYVVLGIGIITALSQLGVKVAPILGGLGVLGLAVGLAAKDTVSNFISGLILLWDRPFDLGDVVSIEGFEGTVVWIGLRSTRLSTVDGEVVVIPNARVSEARIVNRSGAGVYRVRVTLSLPAERDTAPLRARLAASAQDDPAVLRDRSPQVETVEVTEGTTRVEVSVWIGRADEAGAARSRLHDRLAQVLREP